jgi:iron-sulfur cluster insertion protein
MKSWVCPTPVCCLKASRKPQVVSGKLGADGLKLAVAPLIVDRFSRRSGCSGFQYGFTFDEDVADDDTIVEREGVSLVVDPMSFQYLAGAEVDYQEGLEGSRFVIKNPNATTTCGCGSSFSI